jgi:CheY-like chemotaxis protein
VSHIVLIDDSPSDVYLTKLALEESGLQFEMTTFQSGADALRALCPSGGAINDPLIPDLILLDLNTPCSDGFEVLGTIRGNPRLSHVPVAIITSSASAADQHRAALGGATTYIKKPTQLKAFIESVSGAVKRLLADTRSEIRS